MEKENEINKVLKYHERRISALESIIKPKKSNTTKDKEKISLSDHIIELRDADFFSQPKTAEETHKKLEGKYHCEPNRVAVALLRLTNRKELRKATKTINEKKYTAYVW